MKTLRLVHLILALSLLSGFLSCSSDDSDDSLPNSFSFGGETYLMSDGLIEDDGAINPIDFMSSDTHNNMDFTISNGKFVEITEGTKPFTGPSVNTTFLIYVSLNSPGIADFQTGTFVYMDIDNATEGDIAGKFFMDGGEVETDNDGVEGGDLDGPEFQITGGSVVVAGSGPTAYTLTFDLETSGGPLTGTYSGSFTYEDTSKRLSWEK